MNRGRIWGAFAGAALVIAVAGLPAFGAASAAADPPACSSGAHTLSHFGDRVYPEMGNGGYTSLHTDVYLDYDAPTNLFLPGTHVAMTVRSTQCLNDLSFDFEQTNNQTAGGSGPNMTVNSVEVNGAPATFTFVQPTYPGDPNGQNDPDPAAHAVSNVNPVSATNPNPPACSPQTSGNSQNGTQCPANKLVVTPSSPIPDGTTFTVTVDYTGRPGVHVDGDGSTEGWFRVNTTAAPNDGSFVTTEPVGTDSWMPLNNHPSAKPTYDFYDTTNLGKTAVANGEIVGFTPPIAGVGGDVAVPPTSVNPPDANFPGGSWMWHWHSPEPIANYLVENSIGGYDLTARTSLISGMQYYEAQGSAISSTRKPINKIAIDNQEDIVEFQKQFNGPFPLTTDGVLVGIPSASFEEEMQGKITFAGGTIGGSTGLSLGTLNHENMHQWFGDNVSENSFNLTFWKEGFATLGEYLCTARNTPTACGTPGTPASDDAFEQSLINRFNGTGNYGTSSSSFWTSAPSNPTVGNLFTTSSTYTRPGTAYIALWRTLGRPRMISAMKAIQSTYGGSSITEPQLEQVFRNWLPVPSASCNTRLTQFFTEWFDTPYPTGGANTTNKPKVTGPGLNGTGFVCGQVSPASPDGLNGWYLSAPTLTWQGFGASAFTKTGCVDGAVTTEGVNTLSCDVTTTSAPIFSAGPVSETVKLDLNPPTSSALDLAADPERLVRQPDGHADRRRRRRLGDRPHQLQDRRRGELAHLHGPALRLHDRQPLRPVPGDRRRRAGGALGQPDRLQGRLGQADRQHRPPGRGRGLPARQGRQGQLQVRRQAVGPRHLRRHRRRRLADRHLVGRPAQLHGDGDRHGRQPDHGHPPLQRPLHLERLLRPDLQPGRGPEPGARGRPDQARLRPRRRPGPLGAGRRLAELGRGQLSR